ncbi:putative metal-binding motif-containing protein, partial [Hyalangium gracile]|uniref:putative metal-binding motif-containing protein n=1 Tax=Hyalangium gracile TaxID=394092 RepID=UPI001CCD26FA
MNRLCFFGLLLILSACREYGPDEGAVQVSITYGSYTPACVRVSASDSNGNSAVTYTQQSTFKNPDGPQIITVTVFRKAEWTRDLLIEVASYKSSRDKSCSGTELERHTLPVKVPKQGIKELHFDLLAQDDDGDKHILKTNKVAGTDCDDKDANVHPGQPEICAGTRDMDCDDAVACADSECLNNACDDKNPCTLEDRCRPGTSSTVECVGTLKTCQPPNLVCYTNESVCNPATGECVHTQQLPDKTC